MYKIASIILFMLFMVVSCRAIAGDSSLQISLYDDGDFTVVFDDVSYPDQGNLAVFDNINAGEHYLKITKASASVPMKDDVLFEGKVKIPVGQFVYAVIDEYNAFTIYKKVPVTKGRCDYDCSYYRIIGRGQKINEKHGERHDEHHGDIDAACRYKAMKDEDFKKFTKTVGNRNFESTNVEISKAMLDKNTLTSAQVKELMSYFTFESNMLDVAKYAYSHTCDQKNYFVVFDVFTFQSSIEELKNYISGK